MPSFAYIILFTVVFVGILFLAIGQVKKAALFLTVYKEPGMEKHGPKALRRSMFIYLGILFAFTLLTSGLLAYPMVIVWLTTAYFFLRYIK